jgi:hypothetical protein
MYNGLVLMEVLDQVGTIRGKPITRTTKSYLKITLRLPTVFQVSTTDERVYGLPGLMATVSQQRSPPRRFPPQKKKFAETALFFVLRGIQAFAAFSSSSCPSPFFLLLFYFTF